MENAFSATVPRLWKGIALMILTWVLFAIMSAVAKNAYQYTNHNVTFFFQNFGAFVFLRPKFSLFKSKNWRLLMIRSLFGAFSFYSFFFSLNFIPLTDGTLLNTTAPLFLPVVLHFWVKKKSSLAVWLSSLLGFLGVVIILKPGTEIFQLGALPALLAGVGSAIVMVAIRQMVGEDSKRIVLIYVFIASLCALPPALPHFSALPLAIWPSLILIGLLFGTAQMLYTRALSYGEATVLAPFTYTFVIMAGLIEWAVWDRAPTLWSLFGMLLVIAGGVLTILFSRAQAKAAETIPENS
jgi:drug/metabolite transporter (DMT)-like permease